MGKQKRTNGGNQFVWIEAALGLFAVGLIVLVVSTQTILFLAELFG